MRINQNKSSGMYSGHCQEYLQHCLKRVTKNGLTETIISPSILLGNLMCKWQSCIPSPTLLLKTIYTFLFLQDETTHHNSNIEKDVGVITTRKFNICFS
jgi:hypothetical protein